MFRLNTVIPFARFNIERFIPKRHKLVKLSLAPFPITANLAHPNISSQNKSVTGVALWASSPPDHVKIRSRTV